jgi:predicted nucleic acid-binding protein
MGNALLAEFEDLLARAKLFSGSPLKAEEREALLNAFLGTCRWVRIYYLWRPNLRDEADNHIVELAVSGGAEVIVTKNLRDFRNTELSFPNLKILAPEQLLQEIAP